MKIKQGKENDRVLRFLDEDGLIKTLDLNSSPTFILRSHQYYKKCEDKKRGDINENAISLQPNIEYESLSSVLISCWSNHKKSDLNSKSIWDALKKFT